MATLAMKSLASKNAVKQIRSLYESKRGADVHFVFEEDGQSKRISAHRNILAAESKKFDAMFYGKSKRKGDIKIVCSTATSFDVFLQIIYHKLDALNMENIGDVLRLAEEYSCKSAIDMCTKFLSQSVNVDNVLFVFSLTWQNYDKVYDVCGRIFGTKWKTIINTDAFLEIDEFTWFKILSSVPRSNRIKKGTIERFMEWAKRSCARKSIDANIPRNLRAQFNFRFDAFPFEEMDPMQFIEFERIYPVFTFDEYKKINEDIYTRLETKQGAKKRKM